MHAGRLSQPVSLFAPQQDEVFTLLLEPMPLGQTSSTYIFLIKDQEKTRQHLHREDLKDPTELGLREGSRAVEQRKRSSQGGSTPPRVWAALHTDKENSEVAQAHISQMVHTGVRLPS